MESPNNYLLQNAEIELQKKSAIRDYNARDASESFTIGLYRDVWIAGIA